MGQSPKSNHLLNTDFCLKKDFVQYSLYDMVEIHSLNRPLVQHGSNNAGSQYVIISPPFLLLPLRIPILSPRPR